MYNLLSNAIKYSPENDTVDIAVTKNENSFKKHINFILNNGGFKKYTEIIKNMKLPTIPHISPLYGIILPFLAILSRFFSIFPIKNRHFYAYLEIIDYLVH